MSFNILISYKNVLSVAVKEKEKELSRFSSTRNTIIYKIEYASIY